VDAALFETLLWKAENETLDFKRDQYRFVGASHEDKSELLKDILAFANSWRTHPAHILIGVEEVRGGRAVLHGIQVHLDEHSLQQFVSSKTNRPVAFSYFPFPFESVSCAVIEVAVQERPVFLTKSYGRLDASVVYIRRGSSTDQAKPDEIACMGTGSAVIHDVHSSALAIQTSGPGGLNVNIREYRQGLGIDEVRQIAMLVWEGNFPKLKADAANEARQRVESFLSELVPRLTQRLTSTEFERFRLPEVQYAFAQALLGASLRNEAELRTTLADLIVKRVQSGSESLAGIIYSEAIKTVPVLTSGMLDVLALKVTVWKGEVSTIQEWPDFKRWFNQFVAPFLSHAVTYLDFQHLTYAGCGTVASISYEAGDLASVLRKKFTSLFVGEMQVEKLGRNFTPAAIDALFERRSDGWVRLRFQSLADAKKALTCNSFPDSVSRAISALYEDSPSERKAAKHALLEQFPEVQQSVEIWSKSLLGLFQLSSVGSVIGAAHCETKTGVKPHLDLEEH
jgi:Putative DNA-binding domain